MRRNRLPGRPCHAHVRWRIGVRHEVGHGLDARHPRYMALDRSIANTITRNHLSHAVCVSRELSVASPDEVVHGKGSLLGKMPGDDWQKFANLRVLLATCTRRRQKLLFMGGEIGQWREWAHGDSIGGITPAIPASSGCTAMGRRPQSPIPHGRPSMNVTLILAGLEWIVSRCGHQVISLLRHGRSSPQSVAIVCNFTPVPRQRYRGWRPARAVERVAEQRCLDPTAAVGWKSRRPVGRAGSRPRAYPPGHDSASRWLCCSSNMPTDLTLRLAFPLPLRWDHRNDRGSSDPGYWDY